MIWTLWYTDLFDHEMPPQREAAGATLRSGLRALWKKTLAESLTEAGQRSFTAFHLTWTGGRASIDTFRTAELVRLRGWIASDPGILDAVARAHERLIGAQEATAKARSGGEEAAAILDVVGASAAAAELAPALEAVRGAAR